MLVYFLAYVQQRDVFHIFNYYICEAGEPSSGRLYEGVEVVDR